MCCYFDSPVARCEVAREMVLLDETQRECAREHGCAPGQKCPLAGWFTEISGVEDAAHLPHRRCAGKAVAAHA